MTADVQLLPLQLLWDLQAVQGAACTSFYHICTSVQITRCLYGGVDCLLDQFKLAIMFGQSSCMLTCEAKGRMLLLC